MWVWLVMALNKLCLTLQLPRFHYFSLLTTKWFSLSWFGEFGIRLNSSPINDIFLYYHHLSAWYCIYIVGRNSVLVTHGSYRVKLSTVHQDNHTPNKLNKYLSLKIKRKKRPFNTEKQFFINLTYNIWQSNNPSPLWQLLLMLWNGLLLLITPVLISLTQTIPIRDSLMLTSLLSLIYNLKKEHAKPTFSGDGILFIDM